MWGGGGRAHDSAIQRIAMKLAFPRGRPLVVLSLRAKRDVKRRALLLMMRLRLGIRRKVELLVILRISRRRKASLSRRRKQIKI